MSINPRDVQPLDPVKRLTRDITLLTPEQKVEIYESVIKDLSDAEKAKFAALLPKPITDQQEEQIKNLSDEHKASNADLLATKLTAEQRTKLHEKISKMLAEARADHSDKGPDEPGDADEDDGKTRKAVHHGRAHATSHR